MSPERLGQHFLADASWQERIARAVRIDGGTWVEIGAGHGEMTTRLAERAGKVFAVELDRRLAQRLREVTAPRANVEVVESDVMAVDFEKLTGGGRFSVYGNLPYYITSPILDRVFAATGQWERAVFLVQTEVAHRLAARPGSRDYGYLTVFAQVQAQVELLCEVPRTAFRPPPKVDSAVVVFRPLPPSIDDLPSFLKFAGMCFRQKRKTLRNNLAPYFGKAILDSLPEGRLRAEQMSIEDLLKLRARLVGFVL